MKRGWEAKFLELIVWGSVLVEEMHTPETKKYHFSKKFACGGRLSCNFRLTFQNSVAPVHMHVLSQDGL